MTSHQPQFGDIDHLVYTAKWQKSDISISPHEPYQDCIFIVPDRQQHTLNRLQCLASGYQMFRLGAEQPEDLLGRLKQQPNSKLVFVSDSKWQEGIDDKAIVAFLELIKTLAVHPYVRLNIVTVKSVPCPVFNSVTNPIDAVYIGLGQTLAKEFTNWQVRCFSLNCLDKENVVCALNGDISCLPGTPINIKDGEYWLNKMMPVHLPVQSKRSGFKVGGTYLIIGANGGIGGLLSRYLARAYQANLILVGRSEKNHNLIDELHSLGATFTYEQLDLRDADKVQHTLDKYPNINGIVHSALVLKDSSLVNMSEESLMSVLTPKVHGTVNLLNAIRHRQLDFVLFFSSIQSYIANTGQANYTAACVCKDALANLLHNAFMVNSKVINWGFWGSIGIVAEDMYRERMQRLEIGSIKPDEGLQIIERMLISDLQQITVVKASDKALRRLNIEPHSDNPATKQSLQPSEVESESRDTYPEQSKDYHEKTSSGMNILEQIVPFYDAGRADIAYNEASSKALEAYSRASFHQLDLPSDIEAKFNKLVSALANIPYVASIERDQLVSQYPELVGHVNLLDSCLAGYPKILSGEIDPLSVMFPNGSFDLVEPVYRNNPIADYFNKAVAQVVEQFLQRRSGKKIRIIEIGAGTGSTTQFVLPAIKSYDIEYTFTDISFAFLNKARTRFSDYDFVQYKIYNVEQTPTFEQPFDIVVATNVIHATTDLNTTVGNVRRLLSDDGIFILNEITSRQDFATLTFGLTDGWWLSADQHRIPNSPLLTGEAWRELIKEGGFTCTAHHGNQDQQVIVAYTGQIEQNYTPKVLGVEPVEVEHFVKHVIADIMHIDVAEIDSKLPFNSYGIDSLISMELIKPFKDVLGYLPATLLFEYPTVAKLAKHFIDEYHDALADFLGNENNETLDLEEHRQQVTETTTVITSNAATQFVKETIANIMFIDVGDIDENMPFMEYGIDSIISLELIKPLKDVFGYLPSTLLFEYPSVAKLTAYLQNNHSDIVATLSSSPAAEITDSLQAMGQDTAVSDLVMIQAEEPSIRDNDIAIIGISGQFPQADNCEQFWQNLVEGRDCTSAIPEQRWSVERYYNADSLLGGGSYTKVGGFINDVDAFDNVFFNITPMDAERMDPQERLFLQHTYNAMLDAGYSKTDLGGTATGVFVGVMNNGYAWHTPVSTSGAKPTSLFWSIANRTSYFFDWKGPSLAVDTACSSSLTALHLAAQALKAEECDVTVVGGVNLIVHPRQYELLCGMHMLSKTDCCKPFSQGADGFVDGEGICAVVLKRYADAVKAGDRIYGVVRGSAINAGGQANGYSAPNPSAQAALISKAMEKADVFPASISYVEAHGTGTELGDPIEIRGLTAAFGDVPKQSVQTGSVKGNIGHLESAAGLTGVIKVLLQMQHGTLVPSIHCQNENPHLRLLETPFVVNKTAHPWQTGDNVKCASVSSFGAGGANAHVILQQPPRYSGEITAKRNNDYYFMVFSGKSRLALQRQLDSMRAWLEGRQPDLDAISYTLCCCRDHFAHRIGLIVWDSDDFKRKLAIDLQDHAMTAPTEMDANVLIADIQSQQGRYSPSADALVALYRSGTDIPWQQLFSHRQVISLPGYQFDKKRFWIDSVESRFNDKQQIVRHHNILGQDLAPASFTLSHLYQEKKVNILEDVTWHKIITSIDDVSTRWHDAEFSVYSSDNPAICCDGKLGVRISHDCPSQFYANMDNVPVIEGGNIYQEFANKGYVYGSAFQSLQWAKVSSNMVKGLILINSDWGYALSPSLLDAGLQTAILLPSLQGKAAVDKILAPFYLNTLIINRLPKDEPVYCYCVMKEGSGNSRSVSYDIYFTDVNHKVLIYMKELVSVLVNKSVLMNDSTDAKQANVQHQAKELDTSSVIAYELT